MSVIRVLALTRYGRLAASSRLRFYQHVPALRPYGVHCEVVPLMRDQYIEDFYRDKGSRRLGLPGAYLRRAGCLLGAGRFDIVSTGS